MHTLTFFFPYSVLLKRSSLPPISADRHGKVENKKYARNEDERSANTRNEMKKNDEKTKSEYKVTSEDEA